MKILKIMILLTGLLSIISCTNTNTGNEERNPRENLEFFYNVQEDQEEPDGAKVYYYGEHYFRD